MKFPLPWLRREPTPTIHLYSILWNEAEMLRYFFRHYDRFVSRYVFFDDGSTDGTLDILRRHPRVEVRRFERIVADSFVLSSQVVHNSAWKESCGKADWVMISAVDEHLHHADLAAYLRRCSKAGVTLVPALGYQMVADRFPSGKGRLEKMLTVGAPFWEMNKLSLFNPNALQETNFGLGRHWADPAGKLVAPRQDELLLLHYKYVGRDYLRRRNALLASGLGAQDRRNHWGHQYFYDDAKLDAELARFKAAALDVAAPGFDARRTHAEDRWWRAPERNVEFVDIS